MAKLLINKQLDLKQCSKCKYILSLRDDFYLGRSQCKECTLEKIRTGRPLGRPCSISDSTAKKVRSRYAQGESIMKIARKIGASYATVHRKLTAMGVVKRDPGYKRFLVNQNFFSLIDTPEKAYWLGFIATDGNVYGSRIQINLKDREHLEKFRKAIGSSAPIKRYFKGRYELFKISFRNKQMVSDLARYSITPNKTFTVQPWSGPDHLMPHYWRGCVDGDGWVTEKAVGFCGNFQMVSKYANWIRSQKETNAKVRPQGRIYVFMAAKTSKFLQYTGNDHISLSRKAAAAAIQDVPEHSSALDLSDEAQPSFGSLPE